MVESSRDDGWNVLELSSFQLETISRVPRPYRPGAQRHAEPPGPPPHLRELCRRQGPAVRNPAGRRFRRAERRRPGLRQSTPGAPRPRRSGSARAARWRRAPACAATSWCSTAALLMNAGEIPIRGRHNVENVLAAAIAAARAGVDHAAIAAAVRTFQRRGASPGIRAQGRRHRFLQRFEGHQRGCHAQSAGRVRRRPVGDSRRQGQGPGLLACCASRWPPKRAPCC